MPSPMDERGGRFQRARIIELEAHARHMQILAIRYRAEAERLRKSLDGERGIASRMFPFFDEPWNLFVLNPEDRPKIPYDLAFPGIYIWWAEPEEFLYIGESKNIQSRLNDHFKLSGSGFSFQRRARAGPSPHIWAVHVTNINDRLWIEEAAIKHCRPKYNIAHAGLIRAE